ncbi:3-oxo-5-alpha-steroid 4-dehydrogenase-domain-containing protein [Rhodocollybia butyracea]|uniref:very-long-chain enoyl-CoA reductase n=1 Tax=Rhodocollybia butyracea TaxID=206335 RepID=A0A9P5PNN6_9AGAR|nr:3-oxo-5-alpha-steroid 4-dehydrogenase-domain-containing protein [Rhodocollybia butyracea]
MAFSITVSAAANRAPTFARKSFPLTVETSLEDTVEDVKKKIQSKIPKFYASRQRLSLKSEKKALSDEAKLADISVSSGSELEVKDLGPQVGWKTVFVVEYAGPLLIHPIFYYLPRLFYSTDVVHSDLQRMVFAMVEAHFGKRILETLFVHRFSHGTMPLLNIFKNSAHYHILSGVFLAFDLYRPVFSASSMHIKGTIRNDQQFLWICAGLWTFFELSNLSTHLHLRSLRPAGTKKRAIPNGYGFGFVSCPNYFFETLAWAVVCAMTGSWAAYVFTAVGTGQMIVWALKKHAAYKKEFGKAYPRRKAMIPFMI